MQFPFRFVKFKPFHLPLKIMSRVKWSFSFGWKNNFPLKNSLLCRVSNQVYSASSPYENWDKQNDSWIISCHKHSSINELYPMEITFYQQRPQLQVCLNILCPPHNIKGLCPFSSSRINNVSWSQSVGLPPLFSDWKNMRYPCDISNGQPAVAGIATVMQNAPSSDKRGAALGLGGTWGRQSTIQNCRYAKWTTIGKG